MSEPGYLGTLLRMRDEYRANAGRAIGAGEYRKASELLWGAVTQELKALAATHRILISSHRHFFDFVRQLAAELNDDSLYAEFVDLNALHKNFYDEVIPADIFPNFYQRAVAYIERLDALIRNKGTD